MAWFKNLKIRTKLLASFAVVILLTVILAALAMMTVIDIDQSYSYLLNFPQQRTEYLLRIDSSCTAMRQATTVIVLNAADPESINNYWEQFEQSYREASEYIDMYLANNHADDIRDAAVLKASSEMLTEAKSALDNYRENARMGKDTALATGDADAANPIFLSGASMIGGVAATIQDLLPEAIRYTSEVSQANTLEKDAAVLRITISLLTITILSVVIALYLSRLISNPVGAIANFLQQVGTTGDLVLDAPTEKSARENAARKDEIGQCSRAAAGLLGHMMELEKNLKSIAEGDLALTVRTLSDRDNMGLAMARMVDNLNIMFGEINASTTQVAYGSKQIADGSQALAQGSTQQAAAVEQLSASITEISEKTRANAQMAEKAARLAETIIGNAEKGSRQMDEMMSAVMEINQASQSINKVIRVIDDLAFQTNILALNAAVEAARAGQHGKGFAVVAEEVRNLAAKSAEAAKDTGGLIANSIEKAELGARIADETAASLTEIVSGINESSRLVVDIAKSSEEQSAGISQINKGIEQVTQVIQQNSATAQESAAASQQMSGQADMLEGLIERFKLKDGGAQPHHDMSSPGGSPAKKLTLSEEPSDSANGNWGKY